MPGRLMVGVTVEPPRRQTGIFVGHLGRQSLGQPIDTRGDPAVGQTEAGDRQVSAAETFEGAADLT